ncbi:MAG: hypothetical protein NZT92_00715 [Abditibacteriales bacterium]|nr:hypothetical protein [Abditibacteriales bacterium]MDW8364622.1 hypothetical protein [Abditibacteriales bacterium]
MKSLRIASGSTGQRIADGGRRRGHREYGGQLSHTISCAKICDEGEGNGNEHVDSAPDSPEDVKRVVMEVREKAVLDLLQRGLILAGKGAEVLGDVQARLSTVDVAAGHLAV